MGGAVTALAVCKRASKVLFVTGNYKGGVFAYGLRGVAEPKTGELLAPLGGDSEDTNAETEVTRVAMGSQLEPRALPLRNSASLEQVPVLDSTGE